MRLLYLPMATVERAIEDHYATLTLPAPTYARGSSPAWRTLLPPTPCTPSLRRRLSKNSPSWTNRKIVIWIWSVTQTGRKSSPHALRGIRDTRARLTAQVDRADTVDLANGKRPSAQSWTSRQPPPTSTVRLTTPVDAPSIKHSSTCLYLDAEEGPAVRHPTRQPTPSRRSFTSPEQTETAVSRKDTAVNRPLLRYSPPL